MSLEEIEKNQEYLAGDFEYLKYLKQDKADKNTNKIIKFNYDAKANLQNYQKLTKFIAKLMENGKKPEFVLADNKETMQTIIKYSLYFSNFKGDLNTATYCDFQDVITPVQAKALKLSYENNNVGCLKIPLAYKASEFRKTTKFETTYLLFLINLNNTFKKHFDINCFKFRDSSNVYFSINYSTFTILNNALKYYKKQHPDYEECSISKEGKHIPKDMLTIALLSRAISSPTWAKRSKGNDILEEYMQHELVEYFQYTNYINTKKREAVTSSVYAKAFQTKKTINKQTKMLMSNNAFLNNFDFVEIDNTTNEKRFNDLSKYFSEYKKLIPHIYPNKGDGVAFRIRKLGQHKALGLYFQARKTLAIDVNKGTCSFVHECGHWLDYQRLHRVSCTNTFIKKIAMPFSEDISEHNSSLDDNLKISKSSLDYLTTACEIFARGFEVYIKNKYFKELSCPFLRKMEEYNSLIEYKWFVKNLNVINDFYDSLHLEKL